jgi:hypothetical protein
VHAEVTAYRGRIIVELKARKPIPGEVILGGNSQMGVHIIKDTAHNLGVSHEALELLKKVRRSPDANGELDWSRDADGKACFGWRGGDCLIVSPETCFGSSKFNVRSCVDIPNQVPEGARRQLDKYAKLRAVPVGLLTGAEL